MFAGPSKADRWPRSRPKWPSWPTRAVWKWTLLGQTVNSYQFDEGGRQVRIADLLERLHSIEGIRRIKFVTNYPRHMDDALLQAVRDLDKVSPYLHVPAQSGSNNQLKRMKRGYTVEFYRDMLERIRATVPGAAITSDFIVGFCGETEEDFQQTVDLVRFGRFKNSFIFKYSPRIGTKAVDLFEDDVPEDVKRRRNNELLAIQNAISQEENDPFVGQTVEVLVEGPSKAALKQEPDAETVQLTGRTTCDRIVVFEGANNLTGRILPVKISARQFVHPLRSAPRIGPMTISSAHRVVAFFGSPSNQLLTHQRGHGTRFLQWGRPTGPAPQRGLAQGSPGKDRSLPSGPTPRMEAKSTAWASTTPAQPTCAATIREELVLRDPTARHVCVYAQEPVHDGVFTEYHGGAEAVQSTVDGQGVQLTELPGGCTIGAGRGADGKAPARPPPSWRSRRISVILTISGHCSRALWAASRSE